MDISDKLKIDTNKRDLQSSVSQRIPEDLKTDTFIAIIGQPFPNANDGPKPMIVNSEDNPALIKPPDADPLDASPGYHEQKVIDVLDCNNDDPFTLDSFKDLILEHAAQQKDYVLARVITMDPKDESRFYYSYYPGHNINKVLFRTQPEEGLLHRMKAKNPLNNMTIVGDVYYYAISAASVDKYLQKSPESIKKNPLGARLRKILQQSPKTSYLVTRPDVHDNAPLKTRRPSADDVFSYTKTSQQPSNSPTQIFKDQTFWQGWQDALRSQHSNKQPHSATEPTSTAPDQIISPKQTSYLNDAEKVTVNDWIAQHTREKAPHIFYAHYIGSDDDFLMKTTFRHFFKKNAINEEEAVLFSLPTNSLYQGPAELNLPANDDQSRLKMVRYVLGSYLVVIVLVLGAFLLSTKDTTTEQFRTMIIVSSVLLSVVIGILVGYEIYMRQRGVTHEPLQNEDHED